MKSLQKMSELATRFERKLSKTAQTFTSTERGVHAGILFGDATAAMDDAGDAKRDKWSSALSTAMNKIMVDFATKNMSGASVKAYFDISVGSTPNSGKIVVAANVSTTKPGKEIELKAKVLAAIEAAYKAATGVGTAARAAQLNGANKFPLNANKVGAEIVRTFDIDAPTEE